MPINNDYRYLGWQHVNAAIQRLPESLPNTTSKQSPAANPTPLLPPVENQPPENPLASIQPPLPLIAFNYGTGSRHGSVAIQAYIEQQNSSLTEENGKSLRKVGIDVTV